MKRIMVGGIVACCVLGLGAALISCGSSSEKKGRFPLSHLSFVMDRSTSIEHGDGSACASVRGVVVAALTEKDPFRKGQALAGVGHDVYHQDPVVIQLWGTADESKRGSPLLLAEQTLERPGQALEDIEARLAQRRRHGETIAAELERACREAAEPQNLTPIYSVISEVVGSMRNSCPDRRECLLVVQSDLVETVEPKLGRAIKDIISGKPADMESLDLPPVIDLGGKITVFVCGYGASTDVISEPARLEILRLWKERVMQNPKRWVEQAQCPLAGS